jgi:subtilisin family serine protease
MNKNEEIRRDLARTVIKEPLYSMIRDEANADRPLAVIAEANEDYYLGGDRAAAQLAALFAARPVGNGYFAARLLPAAIVALVEEDYQAARAQQAAAASPLARYLAIRRIWYDHPIRPLLDKSVSTVKADAAHRAFLAEGRDIVWAVIDSGIDRTHRHFEERHTLDVGLPLAHVDFTGADSALTDGFGHGTHVAGIIAGSLLSPSGSPAAIAQRTRLGDSGQIESFDEPLSRLDGMAPACKLVSLKVLDDNGEGEVSGIIAAIDRIQTINNYGRNIRIHGVNMSVGYEFDPSWFACGQSPVCAEVNRLVRTGVVVVIAAGNTGYGVLNSEQRPTGGGMMVTINDPGNADLAITVGSTHREAPHTYGVSYFSSKGPTGDGRMKPDLVAPGERILSCCSSAKAAGNSPNVYIEDSGTSMAAPHVSGAIAAFLSIRREYIGNPQKVKDLFLATATDLGRNSYFQGRGLLDLMRAIQSV